MFPISSLAINADNISASKVVYVASTGAVDIVAYSITIFLLRHVGRKWACFSNFAWSGICMFVLLAIPVGNDNRAHTYGILM